jgi:hypothetical protein
MLKSRKLGWDKLWVLVKTWVSNFNILIKYSYGLNKYVDQFDNGSCNLWILSLLVTVVATKNNVSIDTWQKCT